MAQSSAPDHRSERVRALLAERLERASAARESRAVRPGAGPGPVSPAQQRMLFLEELDPGSTAYHLLFTLRLDGPLDAGALERALLGVERRHEVLRSTYQRRDGVETLVPGEPSLVLHRNELPDSAGALAELQQRSLAEPFDLREGQVWRAQLARTHDTLHHLILTVHHIAFDGWSVDVLRRELTQGYAAELGRGEQPAPPAVRYADYAGWQCERLDAGAFSEQLAYWTGRLGDAPPALELPTDRPRPALRRRPGGVVRATVGPELARGVRALAREAAATPFMVLLACFQTLLHRYSGQSDILVGTPVANRGSAQTEALIGLFVNTVVLRADCRPGLPFRELLAEVRADSAAALSRQDLPFERVVESLPSVRDLAGSPLFQVMVLWNPADQGAEAFGDAKATHVPYAEPGTAKFDLTLEVGEQGDGLGLELEYDRELWDEASAVRMLGHFLALVRSVVAGPQQALGALPMLAADERVLAEQQARGPVRVHPGPVDLAAMVADRAVLDGDAVALVLRGEQLTYREFDRRANRLAHQLRALGAVPDQPVGVLLERSFDLVVAIVAAVRSGAPYLPLDPDHPGARSTAVLRDAGARLVVTTAARADLAAAAGCTPVLVDAHAVEIAARPDGWDLPPALPDQLAYVFYTSGSTGRPKGVMVPHRAAHNQIRWQIDRFGIGPGESVLLKTNVTFDDSVVEVFAALAGGARLVLAEPGGHRDPEYLRALMAAERISYVRFVPTMLAALLEHGGDTPLPALRVLKSAGEALPPELAARCLAALDAELYNAYGPTETAVNVTVARCRPDDPRVPIGTPVDNVRCHVLDAGLDPTPVGVPGMLYVGGVQLARGYLGRPDLTAQQFVPDPFGPPGARLYRTGDLVRRRADGELEYLGRADRQVKIRGLRIELGEIESLLAEHPSVGQAVVTAREDGPGGPRLAAYVLPSAGGGPEAGQLRGWLAARLPGYMVPGSFTVLAAFPQLASGKVDRGALPAPAAGDAAGVGDADGSGSATRYEAPVGERELALAAIWADALGVERVGRHDGFFALGGHSLLAMQALLAVRSGLAPGVPLRLIFEEPTVAGFAARLTTPPTPGTPAAPDGVLPASTAAPGSAPAPDGVVPGGAAALGGTPAPDGVVPGSASGLGGAGASAVPLVPARAEGVADVSAAEARIWFADQLDPGDPAYVMPVVCRLRGPVDAVALAAALRALPAAHEALRTTFPAVDGRPARQVADRIDLPLRIEDLRPLDPSTRERELAAVLAAESGVRFDLGAGPLVRAAVLLVDIDELVLALTLHHIVADGWSIQLLLDDLRAAYQAARDGRHLLLPGRRIGAGDYAHHQQRIAAGQHRQAELNHWREQLSAVDIQELPTDAPRGADDGSSGAEHGFTVPAELGRRIRALAEAEHCTPFQVLLAGYAALLARHSGGADEVLLTAPVADRGRPDLDGIVGLLLDTVALRIPTPADRGFRQLLHQVRDVLLDAYEHRTLPFDEVVEALGLDGRALTRYSVTMDPLRVGTVPFSDGVTLEPEPFAVEFAKAELNLMLEDGDHGLGGWFVHRTPVLAPERVRRMAGHLLALLDAGTADPDAPLAALAMLTAAERAELAPGTGDPSGPDAAARAQDAPGCLHTLVLDQAERTPDGVAVVSRGVDLTYGQLVRRASQLARHLIARGVRPGALVALGIGRGTQQPVAVLAVLMAGAAYVALDPAHPAAVTRRVLADSGAVLLVTDRPWAGAFADAAAVPGDGDTCDLAPLPTVVLGDDAELIAAQDDTPPPSAARVEPAALAYLGYTSGSTGRPKGVRTPHRAAAAYLRDYLAARFGLGPQDTALQLAGLPFDASVRDLLGPLTVGARVVLLDDERAADPEAIVAAIDDHGVSCLLSIVPTLLRALLPVAERGPGHGGRLRLLLTAGEPLDLADCARTRAAFAGRPDVVNQYGPTEGTMTTTSARITADSGRSGPAPLGRPVAGARLWIVDRHGDLAPVGVPGEVWIGGDRLAEGYHGAPALTAERFVPEPFSGLPGARAYRTGDLARRNPDGTLTFLGRGDDQVKIRGRRVEPAGIESALRTLPGVAEAAVLAVPPDRPGGSVRLVAWVAPATLAPDAVRAALRGLLPEHQVPGTVQVLPALPRTPNNKVDRRALAALGEPDGPAGTPSPPGSSTEHTVAAVFAEVLGAERIGGRAIGRDDDFFARGGHSLLAARLSARLHRATGRPLPLRAVMDLRTVAALAARLDATEPSAPAASAASTASAAVSQRPAGAAPTPGQVALLRHTRRDPATAAYHIGFHAKVQGPLDEVALIRALDALAARHEALRTGFPDTPDGPVAVVAPAILLPVRRADTRTEPDPLAAALALATADLRAPFDLGAGPPARATLIRCGGAEHVLGLTVHHIVADGWTLSVLEHDLAVLYNALAAGRLPELEPVPGFGRWAARTPPDSPGYAADAGYWAERLRGIPTALPLPTDRPRPAAWSLAGALHLFDLDPALADGVRRLADESDATEFAVLLAAFELWLGRLAGTERLLVAVPVANRPDAESEQVAGPFADILPVPADLRGTPTFRELVARARETFLEAWEHRAVPFERLVEAHGDGDPGRPPLCQAMFAVQNVPAAGRSLDGLDVVPLTLDRGTCRYELHLRCYRTPDGLSGWLEYSTALFEPEGARARLDEFLAVLRAGIDRPDLPLPPVRPVPAENPERPGHAERPDHPDRTLGGR
ncbi:amino acid adenylation domain-containing protein [Streptacidiphilus sp. EB129]|uniref:amino acid adenylation domain-containing protein n=1 Tax=Streptacidiphilus sp. EB129 TaxID=3156262 RepID=UPI00351366F8